MISAPVVPGYEVYDVLGQGGFGTVYRARQLAVGREVALKIDNRVLAVDRDRRRFLREVSSAGHLSGHPHVVDLYDAGTLPDGRPYLVMELCPGGSLETLLRQHGHLPPEQVRDIGVRIADALAAAHAAGVLHRDVKPANILVNAYGVVGLSDFGLASILDAEGGQSATREALTPAYAAPEAFELADPAPAADVYCLAATLYALLCGLPPRFPPGARPGIATIMRLHHQPVPDIAGMPRELLDVLRAGLVTDPAGRLPSASALRDALAAARLDTAPAHGGIPAAGHAVDPAPSAPGRSHGGGATGPLPPHPVPPYSVPPQPVLPTQAGWPDLPAGHPSGPEAPSVTGTLAAAVNATEALPGTRRLPVQPDPGHPAGLAAPGPVPDSTGSTRPTRSRRRTTLPAALVAAVLIVAGGLVTWHALAPGPATGPGATATSTAGGGTAGTGGGSQGTAAGGLRVGGRAVVACAATAGIANSGCPAKPACWGGPVYISGVLVSARVIPCTSMHKWETFAVGALPADVVAGGAPDQERTAASAQYRALCTAAVLDRARTGAARNVPLSAWDIDALTPTQAQFDAGDHAFSCIAGLRGLNVAASLSSGATAFPTAPF